MPAFSRDPEVERSLRHSLKDAGAYAGQPTGVSITADLAQSPLHVEGDRPALGARVGLLDQPRPVLHQRRAARA